MMNNSAPIPTPVASAFDQITAEHRKTLLAARDMILGVAASDPRIGDIEEALRWGEPAYITTKKKTGSTIRLGIEKASGRPAVFFNCKTTLVEEMRETFGTTLSYSKNRAVFLPLEGEDAETALKIGIGSALTYHLRE